MVCHTDRKKKKKKSRFLWLFLALALIFTVLFMEVRTQWAAQKLYPRKYHEYVTRYATQYDIPENLVYAIIRAESNFHPDAVSKAGAVGLMQMIPSTFLWLSDDLLHENLEEGMLYDPETSIRYGCYYLHLLYQRYGDWLTVNAAYNAGNGRVDSWLEEGLTTEDGKLDASRIPFAETFRYIEVIRRNVEMYEKLYPSAQSWKY